MTIDLHLHSTASDGVLTPHELIEEAVSLKLKAIALTDHDSIEGVSVAIKEGMRRGIEVIPAVELSSGLNGQDIHFLGYFIDHENEEFCDWLLKLRDMRAERAEKMLKLLRQHNMVIPLEDLMNMAGDGSVGRAHLAQVMVQKGYIDSIEEAFEKYIGRDGSCYVEKYYFSPQEVISTLKDVGGIAVLAHPGLSNVDEFMLDFIGYGLQGLEVLHGEHTSEQSSQYLKFANANNLVPTGGSDFHGLKNSKRGRKLGTVEVPNEFLDRLKQLKVS